MNLKPFEQQELNQLLADKKLDIPSFRREVNPSGNNYVWLQKNIQKRNPNIPKRLKELLRID